MTRPKGPVLIEREGAADPARAAPVPEVLPTGQAMQIVATVAGWRMSWIARLFWWALGLFLSFWVSVAAWTFVMELLATYPVLGWVAAGVTGLLVLALLLVALREWTAYARMARLDSVHRAALDAIAGQDLAAARAVVARLQSLYAAREDTRWGRSRLADRLGDSFDADGLLHLAEAELMAPLDAAARIEAERAARQVALVTAVVPLALADVVAALTANLRMIRRIAEIYGGRAGAFGGWRLTRAVFAHLLATGAVAVGDDMIHSIAGGGLLSKLSRRFGEGVVNGALTARVGVAAMEVCRPLPFMALPKPRVTNLVSRGLAGLFGSGKEKAADGIARD